MSNIAAAATTIQTNPDWSGIRPMLSISRELEIGLNVVMGVMFLACFYYAFRMSRKEGRYNPIYILAGGTIAVFFEPLGDLVAHVTFHSEQLNAVASYGFHVPTWMVPAYTVAVGVPIIWMIDMIRSGMTTRKWWILYAFCIVGAIAFELPLIYLGAIEYYAPQSFTVFGYPIWMAFMNSTGLFFVPATIIYLLTEHGIINSKKAFVLLPLTPMLVAGSHTAAGFPRGYIMNSGAHGLVMIELAALLSITMALLLVWICSLIVTKPALAGAS